MPYRKIQNLELSSLAQLDIEDIVQYTFVNHGLMQVDKYLDILMQAMVHIAENSDIGHKREDLPDNYKAWSVEKHIIIYKLKLFMFPVSSMRAWILINKLLIKANKKIFS